MTACDVFAWIGIAWCGFAGTFALLLISSLVVERYHRRRHARRRGGYLGQTPAGGEFPRSAP